MGAPPRRASHSPFSHRPRLTAPQGVPAHPVLSRHPVGSPFAAPDKTISPLGFWVRGTARLLTRVISARCRGFMKRTSRVVLAGADGLVEDCVIRRCNYIQQRFVVVMEAVEGPAYCNGKYELEIWLHQPTRAPSPDLSRESFGNNTTSTSTAVSHQRTIPSLASQ